MTVFGILYILPTISLIAIVFAMAFFVGLPRPAIADSEKDLHDEFDLGDYLDSENAGEFDNSGKESALNAGEY